VWYEREAEEQRAPQSSRRLRRAVFVGAPRGHWPAGSAVQGRSDGPVVDASTGETPAARATPEESHVELIREPRAAAWPRWTGPWPECPASRFPGWIPIEAEAAGAPLNRGGLTLGLGIIAAGRAALRWSSCPGSSACFDIISIRSGIARRPACIQPPTRTQGCSYLHPPDLAPTQYH